MDSAADRLKWARARRYPTTSDAARETGLHRQNLADHEAGRRRINADHAKTYGRRFGVSPEWILFGRGDPDLESEPDVGPSIPLAGIVQAGAEAVFIDQTDTQAAPEVIRFPLSREHIAFRVSGDSMSPRFMPGERLVFGAPQDPAGLINQEVMAQIKDGPLVVKVLRRGQEPGRWTLWSHNPAHPPIEDASIEWARPLEGWMK